MQSLNPIRKDVEIIKLLMPPEPEEPTCRACKQTPAYERCIEDGGSEPLCDECWVLLHPLGFEEFLARLPKSKNGNIMCAGGGLRLSPEEIELAKREGRYY